MKIVHLSTNENNSGAAKAALKIHNQCLLKNYDSSLLVQKKFSKKNDVVDVAKYRNFLFTSSFNSRINALPLKAYLNRKNRTWSPSFFSYLKVKNNSLIKSADIIILYWICEGFLNITEISKLLKMNKPIIWRLSDMWPFTGGCHYSYGCNKYEKNCGKCAQLNSNTQFDLSSYTIKKKKLHWKDNRNLTLVAPSKWLFNCIKDSSVFCDVDTRLIPTGVDTNTFKPNVSKKNLVEYNKIILFGSIDPHKDYRKGGTFLIKALDKLKKRDQLKLLIFGKNNNNHSFHKYNYESIGTIDDKELLSKYYSSADVFVAPSIEENLANTVLESMSCGTPVVAFNVGGMTDIIDHKVNGYLADPYNADDLSNGIEWVLNHKDKTSLRLEARKKIKKVFSLENEMKSYYDLYLELNEKK